MLYNTATDTTATSTALCCYLLEDFRQMKPQFNTHSSILPAMPVLLFFFLTHTHTHTHTHTQTQTIPTE